MPKKPPADAPELRYADLADLAAQPFQNIIDYLESKVPGRGYMPGTTLTRILLDDQVAKTYGLEPSGNERGHAPAWCLTIGAPQEPKHKFYGWQITDVIVNAVKAVS